MAVTNKRYVIMIKNMKSGPVAALLGLVLVSASCAANEGRGDREQRRAPPPEAIEACADKAEGDTVSFETPRGDTVSGTCSMLDDVLVAVPERRGRR
jgi:hypothetical protein